MYLLCHQCWIAQSYNWFAPNGSNPLCVLFEEDCHWLFGTVVQCCVTQVVRALCLPSPKPNPPNPPPCFRRCKNCGGICSSICGESCARNCSIICGVSACLVPSRKKRTVPLAT